jgi:hypothetical protein
MSVMRRIRMRIGGGTAIEMTCVSMLTKAESGTKVLYGYHQIPY